MKRKRKSMPSISAICNWYLENPPDWFRQLWSGFFRTNDLCGMLLYGNKEIISSYCWLTKKRYNLVRCHMIPDALDGDNHPSNFVLLRQEVHARCPNVSDRNIFIDWLIAEGKQLELSNKAKLEYALKLAFSNTTQNYQHCVAIVIAWAFSKDIRYEKLCNVKSIVPFPTEDNNGYIENMFLVKNFIEQHRLEQIAFDDLSNALDNIYQKYFVSEISPEANSQPNNQKTKDK